MKRGLVILLTMSLLLVSCGGGDETVPTTGVDAVSDSTTTPASMDDVEVTTFPAPTTSTLAGVEPPPLEGIAWEVKDYLLPNKSITNVWKATVTLTINEGGTVTGNAGCNDFTGSWAVSGLYDEYTTDFFDPNDGQAIVFEDLSTGGVVCDDEDVMTQEDEILDILRRTARWVLIDGNLSLRDTDGKFLLKASTS